MSEAEREFEIKRARDLLMYNASVNMKSELDLSDFQILLDKLVN